MEQTINLREMNMMIRKILCVALLISLTTGCSTLFGSHEGDEPARYSELRYDNEAPIKLKVNKVEVISEFTPSFRRPNVEHLFPISIEKNSQNMGRVTVWKPLTFPLIKLPNSSLKMPVSPKNWIRQTKSFEKRPHEIPRHIKCTDSHQ